MEKIMKKKLSYYEKHCIIIIYYVNTAKLCRFTSSIYINYNFFKLVTQYVKQEV